MARLDLSTPFPDPYPHRAPPWLVSPSPEFASLNGSKTVEEPEAEKLRFVHQP